MPVLIWPKFKPLLAGAFLSLGTKFPQANLC